MNLNRIVELQYYGSTLELRSLRPHMNGEYFGLAAEFFIKRKEYLEKNGKIISINNSPPDKVYGFLDMLKQMDEPLIKYLPLVRGPIFSDLASHLILNDDTQRTYAIRRILKGIHFDDQKDLLNKLKWITGQLEKFDPNNPSINLILMEIDTFKGDYPKEIARYFDQLSRNHLFIYNKKLKALIKNHKRYNIFNFKMTCKEILNKRIL